MDLRIKQTAAPPPAADPLEFVMSDGSVDRMGDVIEPDGWRLDNFHKNPIALFSHDPLLPIGKWHDVGVRDGQLTGRLELMPAETYLQRQLQTAVTAGVLRAVSVGFHSDKFEPLGKSGGLRFTEAELVECSLVSVPANPNALAIAKSLGISPQTQQLIFGVSAGDDRPPRSRVHGVSATRKDSNRKFHQMTTYSERIEHAQQERNGLQDQLAGLPDIEDTQKVSELTGRIGEITNKIFAWTEAEKALGSEAAPITVPKDRIQVFRPTEALPASAPRSWAQPKRKETPPDDHIVRHFVVKTLSFI